jgi:hypothetical protein
MGWWSLNDVEVEHVLEFQRVSTRYESSQCVQPLTMNVELSQVFLPSQGWICVWSQGNDRNQRRRPQSQTLRCKKQLTTPP